MHRRLVLLRLLVVLPLLLGLELLLAHGAIQILLLRFLSRLSLLLLLDLPGQPLGRLGLRPVRLDVRARRLRLGLLSRHPFALRRRRARLLQLGLFRGMRDEPLVPFANKRDELPDGVVKLARLGPSKLLVLLVHQAPDLAVLRLREVVLVRPRERLHRGEEPPVLVEGLHLRPRGVGCAERGRRLEVVLARGQARGLLLLVQRGEEGLVGAVESARVVAETPEGVGREVRHEVDLILGPHVFAPRGVFPRLQDGLPVRVVPRSLVRVGKRLVRAPDLLETLLGLLLPVRILVGMPLQRQLAIRAFQFRVVGVAVDAEDVVVTPHLVFGRHGYLPRDASYLSRAPRVGWPPLAIPPRLAKCATAAAATNKSRPLRTHLTAGTCVVRSDGKSINRQRVSPERVPPASNARRRRRGASRIYTYIDTNLNYNG